MTCAADHNGFGAVEAGLSGRLQTAARPCVLGQWGPRRGPAGRRRRHQELLVGVLLLGARLRAGIARG
jgi:hypothetical protein